MFGFEGFIVGFLGGLHCIGMCGPIALALPVSDKSSAQKMGGAFLYNLGKASTYALLGLLFGLVGTGLKMSGVQQWVSVVCGGLMILSVLIPVLFNVKFLSVSPRFMSHLGIQSKMASMLRNRKQYTLLLIGLLNGLLPCGLVYIALSGALVSETLSGSVWFMFLFGLGTMPYLFLITYFGQAIRGKIYNRLRKLIPVFVVLLGVLFILRGLNLGIPYVSPKLTSEAEVAEPSCH